MLPGVYDIFGNTVVVATCDHQEYYQNQLLKRNIAQSLEYAQYTKYPPNPGQAQGSLKSTVGTKTFCSYMLPGARPLKNWMISKVQEHLQYFSASPQSSPEIYRCWSNSMHAGSEVLLHKHYQPGLSGSEYAGLTTIFYLESQQPGGDLVFVNSGTEMTAVSCYTEDQIFRITPQPGMLIIHTANTLHGVDRYLAESPRISIMADIRYTV